MNTTHSKSTKPENGQSSTSRPHKRKRGLLAKGWFSYEGPDTEDCSAPSLTQPDEALTIQELLHRYTNGLPITGRTDGYYEPEDLSDLDGLDFAERAHALADYKERVAYLQNLVNAPSTVEARSEERTTPSEAEGSQATNV